MDIDGNQLRDLVAAGWSPPKQDYESWREALAVYNDLKGWIVSAADLRTGRPMTKAERDEIDILATVFLAAPKAGDAGR